MFIHFTIAKVKVFSALLALGWHFLSSKIRDRKKHNVCDLRLTENKCCLCPVLTP